MGCCSSIASLPANGPAVPLPNIAHLPPITTGVISTFGVVGEPTKLSTANVQGHDCEFSHMETTTRPAVNVALGTSTETAVSSVSTGVMVDRAADVEINISPTNDPLGHASADSAGGSAPATGGSAPVPRPAVAAVTTSAVFDRLLMEHELQLLPLPMLCELGKTKLGWAKASTAVAANVKRCLRSGARVHDLSPEMMRACGIVEPVNVGASATPCHDRHASAAAPPAFVDPPRCDLTSDGGSPGPGESAVVVSPERSGRPLISPPPAVMSPASDDDDDDADVVAGTEPESKSPGGEGGAPAWRAGHDASLGSRSPEACRLSAGEKSGRVRPLTVHERLLDTVRRPVSGKVEAVLSFRGGRDLYTGAELRKTVGARAEVIATGAGRAPVTAGIVRIWESDPIPAVQPAVASVDTYTCALPPAVDALAGSGGTGDVCIHVDHILEVQAVVRAIEDTPCVLAACTDANDQSRVRSPTPASLNLPPAFFEPIRGVVNGLHNLNVTEGAINMKKGRAFHVFLQRYGTASQLALGPCLLNDLQGRERMVLRTAKAIAQAIGDAAPHVLEGLRESTTVYAPAASQVVSSVAAASLSYRSRYHSIADRLEAIVVAMDVEGDRADSMDTRPKLSRR